jgi:hypothetical protein
LALGTANSTQGENIKESPWLNTALMHRKQKAVKIHLRLPDMKLEGIFLDFQVGIVLNPVPEIDHFRLFGNLNFFRSVPMPENEILNVGFLFGCGFCKLKQKFFFSTT